MAGDAARRLMREYKKVRQIMAEAEWDWLLECEPVGDSLMEWSVDMKFPEDSALQQSLESRAQNLGDESKKRLTFQVRFPVEYPTCPPEVWLRAPRLKYASGSQVTFGGKVCIQLLTSSNWNPAINMSEVLQGVKEALVQEGAVVDDSIFKPYLPAPETLSRVLSTAFPTANGFCEENVQVLSPFEAGPFFGDLSRLEATDKIALSMEHGKRIYEQKNGFQTPIMFEVKTQRGRKFHSGIFDFIAGLPPDIAIVPDWIMRDLGMKDRERVRVRGVSLHLIKTVKVQPHSIEFYRAVQESGQDPVVLLRETLRRFSALTEDTAIPIEIDTEVHWMQIADLEPKGAVRIIDTDVQHDFEFKVEVELAPDLENEAEKTARQDALLARLKEREEQKAAEAIDSKEKRDQAIRRHFERARDAARQEAGANDGTTGDVTVRLRLPGGSQIDGKFQEGVSAAALVALALGTPWAESANPWGLRLLCNFPRKTLTEQDVITKDMHQSSVNVQEEQPPQADEDVMATVLEEDNREMDPPGVLKRVFSRPQVEQQAIRPNDHIRWTWGDFAGWLCWSGTMFPLEAVDDLLRFKGKDNGGKPVRMCIQRNGDDSMVVFDTVDEAVSALQAAVDQAEGLLPGLVADESAVQAHTVKMYEVQRYIQAGTEKDEALRLVEAGQRLPAVVNQNVAPQPPAPRLTPAPPRQRAPARGDDNETKIRQVSEVTGAPPPRSLELLQQNGWVVDRAVNAYFEAM